MKRRERVPANCACFCEHKCSGECIRLRRYLSEIGARSEDPAIRELAREALIGETLDVLS